MKGLTSKDIPLLIVIIIWVIFADTWRLAKATYRYLKPRVLTLCNSLQQLAIAAIACLCELTSQKLISIYIDVDTENASFWTCLDAIAYALVQDVGRGLGNVAEWLKPQRMVRYFLE